MRNSARARWHPEWRLTHIHVPPRFVGSSLRLRIGRVAEPGLNLQQAETLVLRICPEHGAVPRPVAVEVCALSDIHSTAALQWLCTHGRRLLARADELPATTLKAQVVLVLARQRLHSRYLLPRATVRADQVPAAPCCGRGVVALRPSQHSLVRRLGICRIQHDIIRCEPDAPSEVVVGLPVRDPLNPVAGVVPRECLRAIDRASVGDHEPPRPIAQCPNRR